VTIELSEHATPLGEIRIAVRAGQLVALAFIEGWDRVQAHLSRRFSTTEWRQGIPPHELTSRIDAYMAGEVDAIGSIPVDTGGTPFQRRAWTAIRNIAAGSVLTYSELAHAANAANAARAAGTACGANPIWLVIPCHRIVRRNGDLGGYGGGLERKRWLLEHERKHARQ
jgi:methylated-DNA-[protein]-cysteine S-methyltransferase